MEIDQEYHKAEERKQHELPLRLVEKFYQNLYHQGDLSGIVILDKEIDYAKKLLETYSQEEVSDLILYTLETAGRNKFSIRSFGGVKVYLNEWIADKATRAKRAVQEQQVAAQQLLRRRMDEYERWKQQEINRLRATVPVEKIAEWEKAETAQLIEEHQNPMSFPVLVRVRIEARVEKHFNIPTFEEWKA